nr:hypothetical protein [Tanacetum cinerariifolium]
DVDELNSNDVVNGNTFVNPFANSSTSDAASSSSQNVDPSNMHTFYQPYPYEFQWTKDHPLEQMIREPSRPVLTRNQLRSDGDMCMYALSVSTMKPKKNDREDIGKLGAKGDIGFFIGYSADSCPYRIYNRMTKKIMETMNVSFDKLSAMDFKQRSSKPGLQSMTSRHISSGLNLTYAPSTITTQQPSEGELDLLFEAMYDDYIGGQPSAAGRTIPPAQEPQVRFINVDHPSHVYKLKNALCGLKQAPRAWSM